MSDTDFSAARDVSVRTAWRAIAAHLAYERKLDGQVYRRLRGDGEMETTPIGQLVYICDSASQQQPHTVLYDPRTGGVLCDCQASQFGQPCAHAGSVLLLRARLATEKTRP